MVPARNNVTISELSSNYFRTISERCCERCCERTDQSGAYDQRAGFSKVVGANLGQRPSALRIRVSALRVRAQRHRLWRRSTSPRHLNVSDNVPALALRRSRKADTVRLRNLVTLSLRGTTNVNLREGRCRLTVESEVIPGTRICRPVPAR